MKLLANYIDLPLLTAEGYDMPEYFRRVAGDEPQRCRYCFDLRLSKTAATARAKGLDAFTTTLLISPHQQHDTLLETGQKTADEIGIKFLGTDLRKRYSDSRRLTKPMGLYRQQHCGCIYSEWERHVETEPK
jgi:predicted adenine nucleotide alpha hydrolase (AANH) superfamily ATPase